MYGYQESDGVTPGKQGGKFGLNSGAVVTVFGYNANAGKDGAEQDAIDFTAQIGEREYRLRFFPVSKVFAPKGGGEITDTNSEEYKEGYAVAMKMLNATLTSIVEAFVSPADLKAALATPIAGFKDYAMLLERLVKSVPNWDKMPVDVLLQYQWTIKGENDKTYLELPKAIKHGIFICKSQGAGFIEERTESHLKYVNADGVTHPFKRNEWFVKHAFANQTLLNPGSGAAIAGTPAGGGAAPADW